MLVRRVARSLILASLCLPLIAHAQARDPQKLAAAQAIFDEASKAMDRKDYAAACPKLEEVVRLVPEGIGARLTLGECYEASGRLASAWTTYVQAEATAAQSGQAGRRREAATRAERLRPRLAHLTITVPDAVRALPGLAIERDGTAVGSAQWGTALPVDKGRHVVVVAAAGTQRSEKVVEVRDDGANVGVVLEVPPEVAVPPPPAPAATPPPNWPWVTAYGVGLAAAVLSAIAGGLALVKAQDVKARCHGSLCLAADRGEASTAQALGNASTAGLVIAGVGAVSGTLLLVVAPGGRNCDVTQRDVEDAGGAGQARRQGGVLMRARRAIVLMVGAVASAVAGASCSLVLGLGDLQFVLDGGAGVGGGRATTSSASAGGAGGMRECTSTDASKCPDVPPGLCAMFGAKICDAGKCGIVYVAADSLSRRYGTCARKVCGTDGVASDVVDDSNVYDDGNPCTQETCNGGAPGEMDLTGMACDAGGYCAKDPYDLAVVKCSDCDPSKPGTCKSNTVCMKGKCVPPHCTDGVKNSGETNIDCGGATSGCLKCPTDSACLGPTDCASGICNTGKCAAPSCSDNVKNQFETDVDCGGGSCAGCPDGALCFASTDCLSFVCRSLVPGAPNTCLPPTCMDGVQNGDEDGLDCGGVMSMCPPCGGM